MFDIRKLCWSQMVLELVDIIEDKLSNQVSTSYSRKGAAFMAMKAMGLEDGNYPSMSGNKKGGY